MLQYSELTVSVRFGNTRLGKCPWLRASGVTLEALDKSVGISDIVVLALLAAEVNSKAAHAVSASTLEGAASRERSLGKSEIAVCGRKFSNLC